jgi:porphobilinogen synthase
MADSISTPPQHLTKRPRRLRRTETLRRMVRETMLTVDDLIYPLFIMDGEQQRVAVQLGIGAIALFPKIPESLKDNAGTESYNAAGLVPRAVKAVKAQFPELVVIADVALDPYSSEGHDGIVENGQILNDETVAILVQQAVMQAAAGADIVAPSDMMDGRVGAIRRGLDAAGFWQVGIMAYSAKYASAYYGPFRDALDSAPKFGDKKTYQMDAANAREAIVEVDLDIAEGADIVMVKPALAYLDIIRQIRQHCQTPIAAYNVSGEYAMIRAAAQQGWIDEQKVILETLTSMKRAGADLILTYFAKQVAEWLA